MCRSLLRIPGDLHQIASMSPPSAYAYWLRKATRALSHTDFGTWQGFDEAPSIIPGAPPVLVPNFAKDKYDRRFWNSVSEGVGPDSFLVLQLLDFKSAAGAIDAIIASPDLWRLDCDHTVQISNLYATMQMMGVDKFNALVGPNMRIRRRDSSGLKTILHYGRDEYGSKPAQQPWRVVQAFDNHAAFVNEPKVQFTFAPGTLGDVSTEQLLSQVPPGSRVRWANTVAPPSHEFRHENAVKLKDDIYACGGLINLITRNEYTRTNLENAMADSPSTLVIDEVEVFEIHG